MGSIVKSIGKAIKKVAKGIKKVIKKIGPVLLIAAAVYAGVAFYGSTLAGATGATLGTSNFMSGLSAIGGKVTSFFSPTGMAGTAPAVAGAAPATAAGLGAAGNVSVAAGTAAMTGPGITGIASSAGAGLAASQVVPMYASSVAGGMSTGQALVYMTKMNMLSTGVSMVAGFLDDSEEKQMQHDKELLAMRYAYGKPMTDEQKAYKVENPNWIREHPAMQQQRPPTTTAAANTFGAQTMANLPSQTTPPSPYVQQQSIGQPTFGRSSTRQFETPASRAMVSKGPGLITKGTQGRFNPNQQRYS